MKGLILKDFFCLRKSALSAFLVMGVYIVLGFSGVWNLTFLSSFLTVMVAMLPVNFFSFDAAAKWDLYARTLPVGGARVVAARYLSTGVLIAAGLAVSSAMGAVGAALGRLSGSEWSEYVLTSVICLMISAVFNAITMPLLYKFGAERARIAVFGVMGAMAGCGFLLVKLLGGRDFLRSLERSVIRYAAVMPATAFAAAVVCLALSFLLSVRFYKNKEL